MIDLKATNSGDIELRRNRTYPDMKIEFFVSEQPACRLRFLQGKESREDVLPLSTMKISFRTKHQAASNGKTAILLEKEAEIKQRIMLCLRTENGDIATKPDFGSNIVLMKHRDIRSREVQQELKDIVLATVSGILEEPEVTVVPERYEGDFYCQNINIYIFNAGKLVYQFGIRGDA